MSAWARRRRADGLRLDWRPGYLTAGSSTEVAAQATAARSWQKETCPTLRTPLMDNDKAQPSSPQIVSETSRNTVNW